jgi:hypothetical protein
VTVRTRIAELDRRISSMQAEADRLRASAEKRSLDLAALEQVDGPEVDDWTAHQEALVARFFAADVEPEPSRSWLLGDDQDR